MYAIFSKLMRRSYDATKARDAFSVKEHAEKRAVSKKGEKVFNRFASLAGKSRYTYMLKVRDVDGNPMFIRPFIFQEVVMMAGLWEPYVRSILKAVKPSDVVLDVGAYIGYYAVSLGKRAKHVYAFEPSPEASKMLARNISLNALDNVTIYNKPVSSGKQTLDYVITAVPVQSGFLQQHEIKNKVGSLEMDTVALDDVISDRVDWLLVDVEGFELEVLKGAWNLIRCNHPRIIIEIWDKNEKAVIAMLEKEGYNVSQLFRRNFYATVEAYSKP